MPTMTSRSRRISRAWISISVACDCRMPPLGWCSTIWQCGNDNRLPFAPPTRINEAALAAIPVHRVLTGGWAKRQQAVIDIVGALAARSGLDDVGHKRHEKILLTGRD